MKSRGFGDSVAKVTHATGIQQFVKKTYKKDCGCGKRQKQLNDLFPYSQKNKNNGISKTSGR